MRTEEQSFKFRILLNKLILDIVDEIPTQTHREVIMTFHSTRKRLWYNPPELLNNTLNKILRHLNKYMPLDADPSKNPQWAMNVKKIWESAMKEITDGLLLEGGKDDDKPSAAAEMGN